METKSAVKSTTIGGGLLAIAGAVGSYLELAGKLPIGGAAPLVAALGGLLSILGRLKGEIKVIDRLF